MCRTDETPCVRVSAGPSVRLGSPDVPASAGVRGLHRLLRSRSGRSTIADPGRTTAASAAAAA
eukprot:13757815-Alexandrium_andersonii.AAC.1